MTAARSAHLRLTNSSQPRAPMSCREALHFANDCNLSRLIDLDNIIWPKSCSRGETHYRSGVSCVFSPFVSLQESRH